MIPAGRAKENIHDLWVSHEEKLKLLDELVKYREMFKMRLKISLPSFPWDTQAPIECEGNLVGCIAGRAVMNIRANGDVMPCALIRNSAFTAGNIRKESLRDIWDKSDVLQIFRKLSRLEGECKEYHLQYLCMGSCRGAAIEYFGDLYSPDPCCKFVEHKIVSSFNSTK